MELLIHSPAFLAVVALFVIGEALWRTRVAGRSCDVTSAARSEGAPARGFAKGDGPLPARALGPFRRGCATWLGHPVLRSAAEARRCLRRMPPLHEDRAA